MNDLIFVQIASYRDPELLPTIRDMLRKADKPENLRFAIAWQHSEEDVWDNLDAYKNDDRFRIIDIDYRDSDGACWARSLTQEQYKNEDYTLQIDSHHRFVRGWDTLSKQMLADLKKEGYKKPLLTAYLPSYNPKNDPAERVKEVWRLTFDRFTPEGVVFMLPALLDNWETQTHPIPSRFFSAHFIFTQGTWNEEVKYDPFLYFHGEEISLAVRSFTHGYDMFIPHKIIAWHEYTREGRVRHWDENKKWEYLNTASLKRVKKLLNIDGQRDDTDFECYGLGTDRTQKDYEEFAGIRFLDRAVQRYTLDKYEAPNPLYRTREAYEASFVHWFRHCIDVWKESIEDKDWEFWAVIFEDKFGNQINRHDLSPQEIEQVKTDSKGDFYNIWREFEHFGVPDHWVVWPFAKDTGWDKKIEGDLPKL